MTLASRSLFSALLLSTFILPACSWLGWDDDDKVPLKGERVSVLELQKTLEPTDSALTGEGFVAPTPWQNEYWPQAGGYPNHAMQHPDLNPGALKKIWDTDIGEGSSDELPLTAQPVVFNNIIYTLDTESNVTAFDIKSGKKLWSNSARPKKADEDNISGGLAVSANALYVTNGYDEVIAMNPKQGGIMWRLSLSAPTRAAPTVMGDHVYVLTLDNNLTAVDAMSGKKLWTYEGFSEMSGLVGSASPAADGEIVVAAMSSGEIAALRSLNGSVAWSDTLSPSLQTGGAAALPDISGLPVIDKGMVIAASYGGKIAAIDQRTGTRIWERNIGAAKTPWIAGNMVFFISANDELVALGRDTGTIVWVKPLVNYKKEDKDGLFRNALLWNGPVLAGNRLIITAPDDEVLEISPIDGALIRHFDAGSHVTVPPIVANRTLYLLGQDGRLSAWQ